jgi:radical SAM family uncharacterized protein/radical SAM-linked protein
LNFINPLHDIGLELCGVQNPAGYVGGETGQVVKHHSDKDGLFNFAVAFPDLYSIAMSNQAIKIIYNGLNARDSIRCERVFAVESDFENILKKKKIPLYTLETGMVLDNLDMIGFSIGYELGITGVLSILDLGGIPLLATDRTEKDPVVIAGGCGVTNPAVFGDFFDAVFIGEAEPALFDLVEKLSQMKKNGAGRNEILAETKKCPYVWSENMTMESCGHSIAKRAVQADWGSVPSIPSFYPLPNIKPVQEHGVVEIMRGCPNGCRFCHAGIYYRPQRIKPQKMIIAETDRLITEGGYRQISLTSLSSGDYPDIGSLLDKLNERYSKYNVSFQLPSLKVNSFTLPILEKLAEVRKSGLTFAVETPDEMWQLHLNKEVYAQHLVELILEAKKRGWNKAKFYFMVGLPLPETAEKTEEKEIVDFLIDLQNRTQIQCNVNVGTFIPKPHTPYQWARQISPEESDRKLTYIRMHLPRGKFHVGTHDISTSYIEGLISRGDKRAGKVILAAYKKGCRLDAWEDHIRADLPLWKESFAEADYDVKNEILRKRDMNESLPWDNVTLGPAKSFYAKEWEKSEKAVLTPRCSHDCDHRCGVCSNKVKVTERVSEKESEVVQKSILSSEQNSFLSHISMQPERTVNIRVLYRVVFSFKKHNGAEYISHLEEVEIFTRALLCAGLPVMYTTGFNPLPRLEFASTLSLGISSQEEIASLVLFENVESEDFIKKINKFLIPGMLVEKCFIFPVTNQRKRESLSSSLWGNEYIYHFAKDIDPVLFLNAPESKQFFGQQDSICKATVFKRRNEETASDNSDVLFKIVFAQDRPLRNALSDFYKKPVYEIAGIEKIHTLAKPDIIGWTDEMNTAYAESIESAKKQGFSDILGVNELFKKNVIHPEDTVAGYESVDFFELYKRIASINESLIKQREENERVRGAFFSEHPEIESERKIKKSK